MKIIPPYYIWFSEWTKNLWFPKEHYHCCGLICCFVSKEQKISLILEQAMFSDNLTLNSTFSMQELEESLFLLEERKSIEKYKIESWNTYHLSPSSISWTFLGSLDKFWSEGTFLNDRRTLVIVLNLKSDKKTTNLKNFCLISLTICVCNLFKRMVNNRLI